MLSYNFCMLVMTQDTVLGFLSPQVWMRLHDAVQHEYSINPFDAMGISFNKQIFIYYSIIAILYILFDLWRLWANIYMPVAGLKVNM